MYAPNGLPRWLYQCGDMCIEFINARTHVSTFMSTLSFAQPYHVHKALNDLLLSIWPKHKHYIITLHCLIGERTQTIIKAALGAFFFRPFFCSGLLCGTCGRWFGRGKRVGQFKSLINCQLLVDKWHCWCMYVCVCCVCNWIIFSLSHVGCFAVLRARSALFILGLIYKSSINEPSAYCAQLRSYHLPMHRRPPHNANVNSVRAPPVQQKRDRFASMPPIRTSTRKIVFTLAIFTATKFPTQISPKRERPLGPCMRSSHCAPCT